MLSMQPIKEPDVIELINNGRFSGEIEGYVMTDNAEYMGHALFEVKDGITTVLDSSVEEFKFLDGIVRACVAAGENRGAQKFAVNKSQEKLKEWWRVFCKEFDDIAPVDHIFTLC